MRKTWLLVVLTLLAGALVPAGAQAADDGTVVRTQDGWVRGVAKAGVRDFGGIPFAAPPVGKLRWENPRPAQPWSGVRDATVPGPRCAQRAGNGMPPSDREDCLYLNVAAPRTGAHKPVLVWIHGGGFLSGAGSDYAPKNLVTGGDVVAVTINYRLGIFGTFGLPGQPGAGTFSLADQLAALRWVRANAASFGGNPGNVTVLGESAGGVSTCALLTAPAAAGLFDKAIIQSGSCSTNWPKDGLAPGDPGGGLYEPVRRTEQLSAAALAESKCADLACLKKKPVAELLTLSQLFAAFAYGTPLLPALPADALRAGRFVRVPVMNGHTRDEHQLWASGLGNISADRYAELMRGSFGGQADAVLREYPASAYTSPAEAWGTVMTDRAWACPARNDDRALARHTRTYAFEFADRSAPPIYPRPDGSIAGAVHGTDLPYLFDFSLAGVQLTPAQQRLSAAMIDSWTRFARSGTPGWPAFDRDPYVQGLDTAPLGVGRIDHSARHKCAFWATIDS